MIDSPAQRGEMADTLSSGPQRAKRLLSLVYMRAPLRLFELSACLNGRRASSLLAAAGYPIKAR